MLRHVLLSSCGSVNRHKPGTASPPRGVHSLMASVPCLWLRALSPGATELLQNPSVCSFGEVAKKLGTGFLEVLGAQISFQKGRHCQPCAGLPDFMAWSR